ncbi:MAG: thioesterase family protein [Pseudomonadota bacterium]
MARADFTFFFAFRVRYSEVDAQAIVFNAHYLTYFDTAITEYFRALPYDYKSAVAAAGCDYHTVRALVEYKQPLSFDETFDVGVRVARIGTSSVRFALEAHGAQADDLRATGEVVWVYTNQSTGRPQAVPEAFTSRVTALEGDAIRAT